MSEVHVSDYTFPSLEPERQVLAAAGATVVAHQCKSEAEVLEATRGARVVLVQFAPITRSVMQALAPAAVLVRYGVGVDNIDLVAAKELGVQVANVPDYCLEEVADHTVAMLLAMQRKLIPLERELRSGGWKGIAVAKPMLPLNRTTVGFVGLGRIARAVLSRLRPFGCRFVAHDPMLSTEAAQQLGVTLLDLERVLEQSDALTLHSPLTVQTHNLLNTERLALMKPTAIVVNTARGGLIDTEALVDALKNKRLAGAALDVFETEPLPADSPLRNLESVLLTPHLSWYSEDAMERLQRLAAEEALRAINRQPLRCPVLI